MSQSALLSRPVMARLPCVCASLRICLSACLAASLERRLVRCQCVQLCRVGTVNVMLSMRPSMCHCGFGGQGVGGLGVADKNLLVEGPAGRLWHACGTLVCHSVCPFFFLGIC
jgi:hypothetical protein